MELLDYRYVPIHIDCQSKFAHDSIVPRCSARREHTVFQRLLGIVPNLWSRISDSTDEECMRMADLVCSYIPSDFLYINLDLLLKPDTEGRLLRTSRRYKEHERSSPGVVNATRCPAVSSSLSQCQNKPWLPSYGHRRTPLSRRI
jgi:hypothetical protein